MTGWGLVDDLVFEDPGEVVRDEDGVKSRAESGVDVRAGAVADHPCIAGLASVVGREGAIRFVMLFGEDLDGRKMTGEAGAVEFAGLLVGISLGDHDEAMARGQVGEGGFDVGEEFDLLVGDGLREGFDATVLLVGERGVGELLKTGNQRTAEAGEAVAVGLDSRVLDAVEMVADLFGGVDAVIEVRDEAGDGALEVDVIFPERVVGVDQ